MAKIKLMDTGFQLIPEGWYIFKITKVTYDEDFGELKIELVTKNGLKHTERYGLLDKNGEVNEGATKAFSYMARVALNNPSLDEIDEQDLVGCYIKAEIVHKQSTTVSQKTGKPFINANLGDKESAWGFEDKLNLAKTKVDAEVDGASIDDLLGDL